MDPVPLWFGIVGGIAGTVIAGYVVFTMVRERKSALPNELKNSIDRAYRIQMRIYELGAPDDKLEDISFRVRSLISKAYGRDHEGVAHLLAGLEEE